MSNHINQEDHEMRRLSHNFQRGNTAEQRKALVKALLAKEAKNKANKAAEILYEAFGTGYNLTKEDGRRKYHIAKENTVIQLTGQQLIPVEGKTVLGEGQMVMEVNSRGKLKFRLNSDKGTVCYTAEELSNEDFTAELSALQQFISKGIALPAKSKFIKKNEGGDDYNDADIEDRIQNPLK